ncbi:MULTISPECIES: hypothetical protein [Rhizobium]|uniref:hypothetical protein n=1 Tax=Rhizobium TaxID=379 RepID=UPI0028B21F17
MRKSIPLVIFDGNCQGQHLSAILSASNLAESYAIGQDLGFLPSHLGVGCQYVDESDAHLLIERARKEGRWIIQATQSTPLSDQTEMSYSGLVDQIIRYPHLQFYALSPSEIAEKFGPKATPKRVLDMDLGIIKVCQTRACSSIDFEEFIRNVTASRPLFHTALHPNGEVMGMMLRSFAEQIPGVDGRLISCVEATLRQGEGINSATFHPVSKDILDMLGFDWGEDYEVYRRLHEYRATRNWEALLENEALFVDKYHHDTWCWLALTQAHAAIGTKLKASLCLLRLLELSPGQLHSWLCGLSLYTQYNDPSGISALMQRANVFFRGQRIFSQVMAYFHLNTGNAIEAEPYARDYYNRTPDRADSLVPLLKTLWFLGKHQEIQQIFDYVLVNSTSARLVEIRSNLAGSPELECYLPN